MSKNFLVVSIVALTSLLFLACPSDPTAPVVYERIVIDVHKPNGAGAPTDIDITLDLDDGGLTEVAEDQTPVEPGSIDTDGLGLESGTYYLEVYHEKPPAEQLTQAYAVRAISLSSGEDVPGTDVPTTLPTINFSNPDPYEIGGETYSNTTAVLELDTNWVQRYLDTGSDTDWLKLVLP